MTTMTKFGPGELVNVHIEGARILRRDSTARLWFSLGGDDDVECFIPNGLTGQTARVTVERVAPKEWPPQPGDVWADGDDSEWFAFTASHEDGITLRPAVDMAFWTAPGDLLLNHGPVRLVRRRGWTPDQPADEPGPAEVDKRAETIAGLRELADLLESRPDLNFTPNDILWGPGREQLDLWASVLGAEVKDGGRDTDGHTHLGVEGRIRGLRLRQYFIVREEADEQPVDGCPDAPDAEVGEVGGETVEDAGVRCGCGRTDPLPDGNCPACSLRSVTIASESP